MQSWYTWSWFGLQISIQCNLLLATNPFEQSTIETSLIETRLHSECYYKLGSNDQNTSEKKCSVIIVPKTKNLSSEWIRCATFSFFVTHCNEITMKWDYQPVVILSIRCLHGKKSRSIAFRTRIFGKVVISCVSTLTHSLNVWIRMHITLIQFSHEHKSHPVAVSKFAFEIPCKHHCEYYRAKRVPVKMRAHFLMVRKRRVFSKQTSFH